MTRYAVGDLQGCLEPLQCLLEQVDFNPHRDELWLVGDLVNRGPHSLETLAFLYPIRHCLNITLGNHDLHTLALARGATDKGRHATLDKLLNSAELDTYMDWFRHLPLCIRSADQRFVMSHAGIPAIWSTDKALSLSDELCAVLQDDERIDTFLAAMYGNTPNCWSDDLSGLERLRCITNYFTRMRCCDGNACLDLEFKGTLEQVPEGLKPWFAWPEQDTRKETQIFGHWAALEGKTGRDDCIGLDTGCVWGRRLSLLNLDTMALLHCDCAA